MIDANLLIFRINTSDFIKIDGDFGNVLLIFRTVTIVFVLPQLQTAGAMKITLFHHPPMSHIGAGNSAVAHNLKAEMPVYPDVLL